MADHAVARAKHATLTGTTVDKITFSGWTDAIEVLNRHASEVLTVVYGVGTDPIDPTALVDDSVVVPAGQAVEIDVERGGTETDDTVRVKLIGNSNPYSVSRIDRHSGYHTAGY